MVRKTDPEWGEPEGQRLNLQFEMDSPAEVDVVFTKLTADGDGDYRAP